MYRVNIELKKKLVRRSVWSIALYGSETWKLRNLEHKYFDNFKMWSLRRMETIKWSKKVKEGVIECIGKKVNPRSNFLFGKANWLGYMCVLKTARQR